METSKLLDAEFKTPVTGTLKELSEDLSSIKRIQLETKDLLTKIKNNLQGINSRVDEAEKQINDLEHKDAKNQKSIRTTTRKKNPKKPHPKNSFKQPLGQL